MHCNNCKYLTRMFMETFNTYKEYDFYLCESKIYRVNLDGSLAGWVNTNTALDMVKTDPKRYTYTADIYRVYSSIAKTFLIKDETPFKKSMLISLKERQK